MVPLVLVTVVPVFAVVVFVSDGFWVQALVADEVMAPVFSRPSAIGMAVSGTWTPAALIGMSLLQSWVGSWLPLMFSTLSLLKPVGPANVAALATGADTPT